MREYKTLQIYSTCTLHRRVCRHPDGPQQSPALPVVGTLKGGGRVLKGSLTRDFRLQVFFINHCPLGPQVSIVTDTGEHFSPVLLIPLRNNQKASNLSPVSTTPPKNCLPLYNPLPGFFLLPGHLGGFIERCS